MGLNNLSSIALIISASADEDKLEHKNYFAIDYMLETIFFLYCLLFINTSYLYKIDASRNKILLNSQSNDTTISSNLINIQSAENCKEFSETVRQLPDIEEYKF